MEGTLSPVDNDVSSRFNRVEADLQAHAKTISSLVTELSDVKKNVAVMTAENEFRDEKLSNINSLGRSVLIAVITLFIGVVFAYLASGGFRVPPVA